MPPRLGKRSSNSSNSQVIEASTKQASVLPEETLDTASRSPLYKQQEHETMQLLQTGVGRVEQVEQKIQVMDAKIQAVQQQLQEVKTKVEQGQENEMSKFLELAPPLFEGILEPLAAYDWLKEMDRAFDILGCTDENKVTYATFQLRGSALYWWQMINTGIQQNSDAYTWNKFKEVFCEKYFPAEVKTEIKKEFSELRQENMSVAQFDAEFTKLVRVFLPQWVVDKNLAEQFWMKLRPEIQTEVDITELTSYASVLNRALSVEKLQSSRDHHHDKRMHFRQNY
ncbi:hypothetical protein ACH5RR_024914 [Cinchona calisaya]|uniref:Retrotransposon gag domain-containing protein n=1 Tax=Cinchona calisaya TaxID=153742 RepID=A0ABD2Z1C1_9GENT